MSKCIIFSKQLTIFNISRILTIYYYKAFNLTITIVKIILTIFALSTDKWSNDHCKCAFTLPEPR